MKCYFNIIYRFNNFIDLKSDFKRSVYKFNKNNIGYVEEVSKMEKELTLQQKCILDVLRKGYENKVNVEYISKLTGISKREVGYTLAELREFYPVCSTKMDGGGVWIADCNKDIVKFVKEMEKLRNQHQLTINYMEAHIK